MAFGSPSAELDRARTSTSDLIDTLTWLICSRFIVRCQPGKSHIKNASLAFCQGVPLVSHLSCASTFAFGDVADHRSRESGESVLVTWHHNQFVCVFFFSCAAVPVLFQIRSEARHDIAAFCCKGCKDIDDFSPGQDNFSCARLAGGFRLHCIADGHGPGGHWVSDRVVRILPYFLSSRDCRSLLCKGEVESALNSAFERMEEDLESAAEQDDINLLVAGTTVVCILRQIHSPIVWVACVGDSRAIHLCGDGKVSFSTNDHKPSNPVERERVIRHGCEITVSAAENGEELEKIVLTSGIEAISGRVGMRQ